MRLQWLDYDFLESNGFRTEGEKLVKDHSEIYVEEFSSQNTRGLRLAIPVARLSASKGLASQLSRYLLERNGMSKGPGFFGVSDDIIWYIALLPQESKDHHHLVERFLGEMVNQVERLGPKILNMEGQ